MRASTAFGYNPEMLWEKLNMNLGVPAPGQEIDEQDLCKAFAGVNICEDDYELMDAFALTRDQTEGSLYGLDAD